MGAMCCFGGNGGIRVRTNKTQPGRPHMMLPEEWERANEKCEWNNYSIKDAHKISRILPDFICKPTHFHLVFNFEQTRTVTIFKEHGITAHIP